jgi:hypothetical protein
LCSKGLLLDQGLKKISGSIDEVLAAYQEEELDLTDGKRGKVPTNASCYFTNWELDGVGLQNKHACFTGDTCIFSFGLYANEQLKNCEVRFALKYKGLVILHTSSLSKKGTIFSVSTGYYQCKFKLHLPIRDAKLEVEVYFISQGKIIDSWVSSTKLSILSNYTSHLHTGLIDPDTEFSIHKGISELTLKMLQ